VAHYETHSLINNAYKCISNCINMGRISMQYLDIRQYMMVKAIKTRNLDTILRTAEYLDYSEVLKLLRSKKFNRVNSEQLNILRTVIFKGEYQNET